MDRLTPEERSRNMSKIRSRNSRPEMAVRSLLHRMGFRFRLHRSDLPGTPDIVLPKYRTAIFVQGCFWHRHEGCRNCAAPKTNVEFWEHKFLKNILRDRQVVSSLEADGWRVIIVWECEVADTRCLATRLNHMLRNIA